MTGKRIALWLVVAVAGVPIALGIVAVLAAQLWAILF